MKVCDSDAELELLICSRRGEEIETVSRKSALAPDNRARVYCVMHKSQRAAHYSVTARSTRGSYPGAFNAVYRELEVRSIVRPHHDDAEIPISKSRSERTTNLHAEYLCLFCVLYANQI